MKARSASTLAFVSVALLFSYAAPAQPTIDPLDSFELHPDFEMALVAREPIVFDPVDLEFDEQGRAFVVEMPGYPLREMPGRIVQLEDRDGDGIFDQRTVYADGLAVADSILPYRGGLLVASPPDLLFLKDNDGDGVADENTVVLTGFPDGNTQHNFNGLSYGLDNWIYAGNGGNSGAPYWPDTPEEKMSIRWNDFRFAPAKRLFETIGPSSGGFELAFNSYGQLFETHNLKHIMHLEFPSRYTEGLSGVQPLHPIASYAEGGLTRVYPIGEQVVRPNHPEQAGYFSAACGITCYTGGAFPEGFNENVFVCDAVLNLVHRMTIHPDGTSLEAKRGREKVEFLASRDRWFRPVNMTVGPDGALYLLDMYREHIEHPEWIPDEMEAEMDLKAGLEQGRIYRIVPRGGLPPVTPVFQQDDLQAVVDALGHPNKWWRDTAQRLLVAWNDAAAVPLLEAKLRTDEREAVARIHALWALHGLDAITETHLRELSGDPAPEVREQALIALEYRLEDTPALIDVALDKCDDPNARVRRQALLCLSTQSTLDATKLQPIVQHTMAADLDDNWMGTALLAASRNHASALFPVALDHAMSLEGDGVATYMSALAGLAAADDFNAALTSALNTLSSYEASGDLAAAVFRGIGSQASGGAGLDEATLRQLDAYMAHTNPAVASAAWTIAEKLQYSRPDLVEPVLEASRAIVLDKSAPPEERIAHLDLLSHVPFEKRFPLLKELVLSPAPGALQEGAMAQLSGEASTEVAAWLIAHWRQLGPALIRPATDILLYRSSNQPLMLDALESGALNIGQFNMDLERRRRLLFSKDDAIRTRAENLFTDAGVVTRREAIDAMKPALELAGSVEGGQAIYLTQCAQCHQIGSEGHDVGPNLTEIFRKDKKTLLQDILDPNAAVDPQYINYTVEPRTDGDVFADASEPSGGIIVGESANSITLRAAGGSETTYTRDSIGGMTSTGLSIMPEGLELGISHQQMADLLAFLQEPK